MFGLIPIRNKLSLQIRKLVGFRPGKIQLYELALIPKSSSPSLPGQQVINNERLEYLGDAVLEAIITDYLFNRFPGNDEGFLTKIRSKFVKRDHLNTLGLRMGLNQFIKPPIHQNQHKKNIVGDTLEAFIGAIYLDKGYKAAKHFVIQKLIDEFTDMDKLIRSDSDFKSQIIEWGQKYKTDIQFVSSEELKGDEKSTVFISHVEMNNKQIGKGTGNSKKEAEQNAAENALNYIEKYQINHNEIK